MKPMDCVIHNFRINQWTVRSDTHHYVCICGKRCMMESIQHVKLGTPKITDVNTTALVDDAVVSAQV
jgi:hypothetical protein